MKNVLNSILKRKKILFCYFLILISAIFMLLIIIIKPTKSNTIYLYDTGNKSELTTLPDGITQYIKPNVDHMTGIYVYFEDDSIMNCSFHVTVTDSHNKEYYNQKILKYESNILYLPLNNINNSSKMRFKINIDLLNCSEIKASLNKSLNENNYLEGNKKKSLKITVISTSRNNKYYWYVAMIIFVALLLFPLARDEE